MLLFVGMIAITGIVVNTDAKALDPRKEYFNDSTTARTFLFRDDNIELEFEQLAEDTPSDSLVIKIDYQAIKTLFSSFFHLMGESLKNKKPSSDDISVDAQNTTTNPSKAESVQIAEQVLPEKPIYADLTTEATSQNTAEIDPRDDADDDGEEGEEEGGGGGEEKEKQQEEKKKDYGLKSGEPKKN